MIVATRIPIIKNTQGYYLRWYYNGWHYWQFVPGALSLKTEGQKYRTYGTNSITVSSGQVTLSQINGIKTILSTKEVYIYTDGGWGYVKIETGGAMIKTNYANGYEITFSVIIGSRQISRTGFSPGGNVPVIDPVPDLTICQIIIGNQIWMCKNYDSQYPGSKVYDNNEANRAIYGGLYNSSQIVSSGFCPMGWHVPTAAEWNELIEYSGGTDVAGGKLKEIGTDHWQTPNAGAVNSHDFKALGAGRVYGLSSNFLKQSAFFWTIGALVRIDYDSAAITIVNGPAILLERVYASVRLIKNTRFSAEESIYDLDGNEYNVITIGTKQWIGKNLKVTKYADGSVIPSRTLAADWIAEDGSVGHDGAYCWYDNDIGNKNPYGALYNHYAVSNAKGLVYFEKNEIQEIGWRVASEDDWNELINELGGSLVAGGKLKEMGLIHWNSPNTGASNEVEFTAVAGGYRDDAGTFENIKNYSYMGTDINSSMYLSLDSEASAMNPVLGYKFGFSIRCLKDVSDTVFVELGSGLIRYRKGIRTSTGRYFIDYSDDGGVTWTLDLVSLEADEDIIIINIDGGIAGYRHLIRDGNYVIDYELTPLGFGGIENTDWINVYTKNPNI